MPQDKFQYVDYLWDDATADRLDPVERLRYRSNLLGADQRITNTGGGNTSSKLTLPDPLTGEDVRVMYVKGSGGDLRTAKRENFASLYMEKLERQREIYLASPDKGCKTPLRMPWWRCSATAPTTSTPAPPPSTPPSTPSSPPTMSITPTRYL
jgi:rhamnose utilization protein RhaD (predicted bifunctional aldolase and dehydrogenase)